MISPRPWERLLTGLQLGLLIRKKKNKENKTKQEFPHFHAGVLQGCCCWADKEKKIKKKKKNLFTSHLRAGRMLPESSRQNYCLFGTMCLGVWGFIKNSRGCCSSCTPLICFFWGCYTQHSQHPRYRGLDIDYRVVTVVSYLVISSFSINEAQTSFICYISLKTTFDLVQQLKETVDYETNV